MFTHYLITRFNVVEPSWDARIDLDHRWPLFEQTISSVLANKVNYTWLLLCDYRTEPRWVSKINELRGIATPVWVGEQWVTSLQRWLEKQEEPNIITTRLDSDDRIEPGYLEAIQGLYDSRLPFYFIDAPLGWKERNGQRIPYREECNPFLSLVENGSCKSAYFLPHGRAVKQHIVRKLDGRQWTQVIHSKNLRNR